MSAEKLLAAIREDKRDLFPWTGQNLRASEIDDHMQEVLMQAFRDKWIDGMEIEEAVPQSEEAVPWIGVWTVLEGVSDVAHIHSRIAIFDMAAIEI